MVESSIDCVMVSVASVVCLIRSERVWCFIGGGIGKHLILHLIRSMDVSMNQMIYRRTRLYSAKSSMTAIHLTAQLIYE